MDEGKLAQVLVAALGVPANNPVAIETVHKLIECLDNGSSEKVYAMALSEVRARLKRERSNIDQQLSFLEDKSNGS